MARQLDLDRLPGRGRSKEATVVDSTSYRDDQATREASHQLDEHIQTTPGQHPATKRASRSYPLNASAPLRRGTHRPLPVPDSVRARLSGRQQDLRSKTRTDAQLACTASQLRAVNEHVLSEDDTAWKGLNDQLSAANGDRTLVGGEARVQAGRLDRAIQKYEERNDRDHIIYVRVQLPGYIDASNIDSHIRQQFAQGDVLDFDRYTLGAHTMHEVAGEHPDREVILEVSTRRGAYLGQSRNVDDTAHLLPRGMRLTSKGSHRALFRKRDGTLDERVVLQATDHDVDPHPPA